MIDATKQNTKPATMDWRMRLKAPDFWLSLFAALGALGAILLLTGKITGSSTFIVVGLILGAPIVLGAVFVLLVAVPYVVVTGRKAR